MLYCMNVPDGKSAEVAENLEYLNPPVKNIFQDFVSRIRLINPDLEAALDELRARIADDVFKEWVDALKASRMTDR